MYGTRNFISSQNLSTDTYPEINKFSSNPHALFPDAHAIFLKMNFKVILTCTLNSLGLSLLYRFECCRRMHSPSLSCLRHSLAILSSLISTYDNIWRRVQMRKCPSEIHYQILSMISVTDKISSRNTQIILV
jgi:hypothetical protein